MRVIWAVVWLVGVGVASAATFTVNIATDSVDLVGGCTAGLPCSLNDAVIAADNASTASTIAVAPVHTP